VEAQPANGCTPLTNPWPANHEDGIVFIRRDRVEAPGFGCKFTVKVQNAQNAGYAAVIVYNVPGMKNELAIMNAEPRSDGDNITIPSVFVLEDAGTVLLAAGNNTIATVTSDQFPEFSQYFTTMAAAAVCSLLLFAMVVVYRRQHRYANSIRSAPRMTRRQAINLPTREPSEADKNENCCICLDSYHDGEVITDLPCGHFFHKSCIDPWLVERTRVCPICKRDPLNAATTDVSDRTPLLLAAAEVATGGSAAAPTSHPATSINVDMPASEDSDDETV
jgi:hypothetical protein